MTGSQRTLEEQFFASDRTELDRVLWNRFVRELGVRLRALDRIVIDWEKVSQQGIQVALDRINEVLLPASVRIREVAELGFLVATSSSERTLAVGQTISFIIDEDRRDLFTPGPFLAVTRLSTPDDYAVGRLMYLNRETGVLDVQIEAIFGDPGPHDDWQFSAVAGAVQAQVQLLANVQGLHDAVEQMAEAVASDKGEVTTLRGQTLTFRNEAETFRNTANIAAGTATGAATLAGQHKDAAEAAATGTVRHDIEQTLSPAQRLQALANVGATVFVDDNCIINGDMVLAQRGASHSAEGYGSLDRWRLFFSGGTVSLARDSWGPGNVLSGAYALRASAQLSVSGQSAASSAAFMEQRIEGVRSYEDQIITILGWIWRSSGSGDAHVSGVLNYGTGGSPSGSNAVNGTDVEVGTTPTPFAVTLTVPSMTGKLLGTNGNDYFGIRIWASAGTDYLGNSIGIGAKDCAIQVSGVHIRRGIWPASAAAFFRPRHPAIELDLCQRYYETSTPGSVPDAGSSPFVAVNSITSVYPAFQFKTVKRITPALAHTGVGTATFTVRRTGFVQFAGAGADMQFGWTADADL